MSRYEGRLADIRGHIPEFNRHSFGLLQKGETATRLNERLDVIIRQPVDDDDDFVPVGIVSKGYVLVPHRHVAAMAVAAIRNLGVGENEITCEMLLSQYAERMVLHLFLPARYDYCPGGESAMKLRLVCVNSIEGSGVFRAFLGWYRFICSNGLIVGITRLDIKRRHAGNMRLPDIGRVIAKGLEYSVRDREMFEQWKKLDIRKDKLMPWVEGPLKLKWGLKAAARVNHIAGCGHDAILPVPIRGTKVSDLQVKQGKIVPGCRARANNAFEICQILSWIAGQRKDYDEQIAWQRQIPGLMNKLVR